MVSRTGDPRPMGDTAVLLDVEGGHAAAQALARTIQARDVVPAASTVGITGPFRPVEAGSMPRRSPVTHEVPVVFDGEDLAELGLIPAELSRLLGESPLEVAWLGFMPGFAYLVGLPDELAALPRRAIPRTRVPAGSLAIGGGYAGIYPAPSPGGWHLLGRTSFRLFELSPEPAAVLLPGDLVHVVAVPEVEDVPPPARPPLTGHSLQILDPGPLLLVEDGGRSGAAHLGVPRAGTANECWHRIANRAVGNDEWAAALELAGGIRLRARRDLLLALAGDAALRVDGAELPPQTVAAVGAGQLIETGPVRQRARAVLAVAGGLDVPSVFASRSGDAVSGLPPGPLRTGDVLDVGTPPPRSRLHFELPAQERPVALRAIAGPDAGPAEQLLAGRWVVDARSDRTGVRMGRLDAGARERRAVRPELPAVPSHAVVPGCIQLPPGGEAVVLGPDCGPVGGYPVLATVISADVWRLGTLVPGDEVEISLVSLDYAARCRERLDDWILHAATGWYPTTFA